MKPLLFLIFSTIIIGTASAQITKPEYDKMWQAVTATYKEATALADQKKANTIVTQMEVKYPKDASVMLARGVYTYRFLDDLNKSLTSFSNAIQAKPHYALALLYRAKVLAKKGVYEKAIEDLNIVIGQEPENILAIKERADDYFLIKDYDKALADYKTIVALQPAEADSYDDVANTLVMLGRKADANTTYKEALIAQTADTTILHALYGKYLVGQEKYQDADLQYRLALNGNTSKLEADDFNTAGVAAYKLKFYRNAIYCFRAAQFLDPKNISYIDNEASVDLDYKNYDNIIRDALKMLQINPNDAKANKWMSLGILKSGRSIDYTSFDERSRSLEATGKTEVQMPDSILFFVPKDKQLYKNYLTSTAYKTALDRYVPDFNSVPDKDWITSFRSEFTDDNPCKQATSTNIDLKTRYENKTLFAKVSTSKAVANFYHPYGLHTEKGDICLEAKFKVNSVEVGGSVGIYTVGKNEVNYYFLVNPLLKRYYIGYQQNNKFNSYHNLGERDTTNIPGLGQDIHLKIITQNRELAFIINDAVVTTLPLEKFWEINSADAVGVRLEGICDVEISKLEAAISSNKPKAAKDLAALDWYKKTTPTSTSSGNGLPRSLVGTIVLWGESTYTTQKFGQVFEIWGDPMATGQQIFNKMLKNVDSHYTYRTYTWRPSSSSFTVTKGWDLRDYHNNGTYFTNGDKVQ